MLLLHAVSWDLTCWRNSADTMSLLVFVSVAILSFLLLLLLRFVLQQSAHLVFVLRSGIHVTCLQLG